MDESHELTEQERSALIAVARDAIRCALTGAPTPSADVSPALQAPAGAFVTLRIKGDLRGCIGTLDDRKPLVDSVMDAAVAAATRDRRFPRLTVEELERVDLEISVLGPFLDVSDESEIVVGRHGVYLRAGMNSGIFLPQVATEQGWDRKTYLDHLCIKAGVAPGTWRRPDARLQRFTAEVFGESREKSVGSATRR